MVQLRWIAFLLMAILLAACQSQAESQTVTPANKSADISPTLPIQTTPSSAAPTSMQGILTISVSPTPGKSFTLTGTPAIFQILNAFPLVKGTSWTYTKIGYSQAPNDPKRIIRGTTQIKENVADTQSRPPYLIVHILGNKTLLNADPGWQESGVFGLGDYKYWYVVLGDKVYLSYTQPDPQVIDTRQMTLEFQFPMAKGAKWCPNPDGKGFLTPLAQTPAPCAFAGMRLIDDEASYQTRAGEFKTCFRMNDQISSGGVTRWFCNGVGIVAEKYDHAGSQFGFTQELIQFIQGR